VTAPRRPVLDVTALPEAARLALGLSRSGRRRRPAVRPEAAEQRAGLELLATRGWVAWRIGQYDARRTQDPGVPDVYALHPRHGGLWWEVKRETGGRLSDAQKAFREQCQAAGVAYVAGPCSALRDYLNAPA
jgi:hypothetical protein